ncbi:hypothetical protein LTR78_008813 [Recurvomyces mirabilis]|uniref:Uncharacterized protein n=1 Tax=Recurvomyces mirabilis TaxID=574656 RepID=A0AAE0WGU4_9PEZI|nr:hypothetical protein LTR78_008813 [Recurvomyces mirabilis]KAK5160950.1 hypothetical protein LTS14_000743 [Recurvomyces mirabilis]
MATAHQIQNALLTEHFRYTPLTLLDDIINNVNELVFRAVNAIEEGLNAISPQSLGFKLDPNHAEALTSQESKQDALDELKQTELGNGCVQLESLLNSTVDRDFDKFEIYTLRNILALGHEDEAKDLAGWVQLEHYRHLEVASPDSTPTPEAVQLQRRKLQETQKLNAMLKAEEAKNAAILEQLHALLGTNAQQQQPPGDGSASPFAFLTGSKTSQNVAYTMTHLPALREILLQLKDSLHTLPNARHTAQNDDSRDAKRRTYLDAQSKRAVQRRGVEADSAGAQAGGTGAGGRRVARDEVEGMEAVVQALVGGAAPARRDGEQGRDEEMEQ